MEAVRRAPLAHQLRCTRCQAPVRPAKHTPSAVPPASTRNCARTARNCARTALLPSARGLLSPSTAAVGDYFVFCLRVGRAPCSRSSFPPYASRLALTASLPRRGLPGLCAPPALHRGSRVLCHPYSLQIHGLRSEGQSCTDSFTASEQRLCGRGALPWPPSSDRFPPPSTHWRSAHKLRRRPLCCLASRCPCSPVGVGDSNTDAPGNFWGSPTARVHLVKLVQSSRGPRGATAFPRVSCTQTL